jgi:hypothetical protein
LARSDFQLTDPLKDHLGSKRFVDDEEVEMEVWKRLRQESKDFSAAGLDALAKRWDKYIDVGGGYVEIQVFPGSSSAHFTFYSHM